MDTWDIIIGLILAGLAVWNFLVGNDAVCVLWAIAILLYTIARMVYLT